MSKSPREQSSLKTPYEKPRAHRFKHEGRQYSLHFEAGKWRLRSKSKRTPLDYRTGTSNIKKAEEAAKDWLKRRGDDPVYSRKGGGTVEGLVKVYLDLPKRTKPLCAANNVSRLRTICRVALGRELKDVTCREISPDLWRAYQRAAIEKGGHSFDLVTRRRENIGINSAINSARALFIKSLLPHYRLAGLDVRPDANDSTPLPVPYVPPKDIDDGALLTAWQALRGEDLRFWLAVGLARFAGMRRAEIYACRGGWIEDRGGIVSIVLRDRPEEGFWSKTGRPYKASVINAELADYLRTRIGDEGYIVPGPPDPSARLYWFEVWPQKWLKGQGITSAKPLHRLRGAYADAVAVLTSDAVTARLAGVKAAQDALGHTSSATTERHYLTPE
jgi:integrase